MEAVVSCVLSKDLPIVTPMNIYKFFGLISPSGTDYICFV